MQNKFDHMQLLLMYCLILVTVKNLLLRRKQIMSNKSLPLPALIIYFQDIMLYKEKYDATSEAEIQKGIVGLEKK